MKIRVFLIDSDYDWVDRFRKEAASSDKVQFVGSASSLQESLERIDDNRPDVILLDQSGNGVEMAPAIASEYPNIPVFLTVSGGNYLMALRDAKRHNLEGAINKPYTTMIVVEEVASILGEEEEAESIIQSPVQQEVPIIETKRDAKEASVFETVNRKKEAEKRERIAKTPRGSKIIRNEVVVCYSPKGGTGKSTIACNLAAAFKHNKELDMEVCLIDLDVSWGNVEAILHVEGKAPTILDWRDYDYEHFDKKLVDQLVFKHSSGIDIIASPSRVEESVLINMDQQGADLVDKVMRVLSKYYDAIVVDLGPSLAEDSTLTVVDIATQVIMVVTTDYPTLRNVVNCSGSFENLTLEQSKVKMVFNQVLKDQTGIKAVTEHVPYPIVAKIPFDENVQYIINNGDIPFLAIPRSAFAKGIRDIVNSIAPLYPHEPEGFFEKILRRFRK